jgi:hypothetical protein
VITVFPIPAPSSVIGFSIKKAFESYTPVARRTVSPGFAAASLVSTLLGVADKMAAWQIEVMPNSITILKK